MALLKHVNPSFDFKKQYSKQLNLFLFLSKTEHFGLINISGHTVLPVHTIRNKYLLLNTSDLIFSNKFSKYRKSLKVGTSLIFSFGHKCCNSRESHEISI